MINLNTMTVAGLCLRASAQYQARTAFEMFREGKTGNTVSYTLLGIRVRQIAMLLEKLGVHAGDRVLLLSENRPEWPLAYFGIALAGAVSVPVLTGFSQDQIRHICEHSGAAAICLSRAMAAKTGPDAPLVFIDGISTDSTTGEARITVSIKGVEEELPLHNLTASGREPSFPCRNTDDLASIVYTSGTLGYSKGVMLSNRNIVSCACASQSFVPVYPTDRLLSVLPLAHTYECTLGLLTAVMNGAKITYLDQVPSPSVLLPAAQAVRPTCMVTVPLLIEKIYRRHIAAQLISSPLYRFSLTRPLAMRLAGRKLKAALGGSIRFFGIGGAPLAADTEEFLRKAHFPYAPGYGLTETAPLAAGTGPYRFPFRSAGSPPKGMELRISTEGEIQARGPQVMAGYYRDEEQTRSAFTQDGWLRTGDVGSLDKKGCLFIKGRLKALILGPSGENIYPEEIEGLLSGSPLVEDALVYGSEKGELVALVRISENARANAKAAAEAATQAATHAAVQIGQALEDLRVWTNKKLAAFSRLSRIEVREEPFEKTPTLKIKRYLYNGPA